MPRGWPSLLTLGWLLLASSVTGGDLLPCNRSFEGPPRVFILGAAKAGTTSLTSLLVDQLQLLSLSNHMKEPNIFHSKLKTEFFGTYIQGFHGSRNGLDASANYFTHCSKAPEHIFNLYTPSSLLEKRFIVLLRDPLARAVSRYHQILRECTKWSNKGGDEAFLFTSIE